MSDTPIRVAVIMAGGSGERFWPLSRFHHPKQLLHLSSETQNMLEEAVSRIAPLIPAEHVYIATARHLQEAIRKAERVLPPENILAEPCKRNTAGCLVYVAAQLLARYGEGRQVTMAVLTADHLISDADGFRETVSVALNAAEQQEALVTLGIKPTRPETGYGYIEAGTAPEGAAPLAALPVAAFREKPGQADAEAFVASGRFYWNSGMFFWRLDVFLRELSLAQPVMAEHLLAMAKALRQHDEATSTQHFEALESISIDYALMEKAQRVLVVPAAFPWDDVGAWTALDRTREHDAAGNVAIGDPLLEDCENCIVYNAPGADAMAVGVVGMQDVIVVTAADAVLVLPKDRAQEVKRIVEALKARGSGQV